MNRKIYWFCFKRQCREFYELLTLYKLISCNLPEFMSHFTGKKFYDDEVKMGAKLIWHGEEITLKETVMYLAEKGFLDKELASSNAMEEHFEYSDERVKISKSYYEALMALFPETTGYKCKTRLYYKERNRKKFNVSMCCIN